MKITDIQDRLQSGARLMMNLPRQPHHGRTYNLDCGSAVRPEQFEKLRDQLAPCDPPPNCGRRSSILRMETLTNG